MRYVPPTMEQPKKLAKSLKRSCFEISDIEIKLSRAQEIVATMYGWENWHAMHTAVSNGAPKPHRAFDEEAVAVRRFQYVRALAPAISVIDAEAAEIVDQLRPDTLKIR